MLSIHVAGEKTNKQTNTGQEKKILFYGRRDSKKRSVERSAQFLKKIFCLHFVVEQGFFSWPKLQTFLFQGF